MEFLVLRLFFLSLGLFLLFPCLLNLFEQRNDILDLGVVCCFLESKADESQVLFLLALRVFGFAYEVRDPRVDLIEVIKI